MGAATASPSRRAALRRYPALAFLVAAGVLALLLPSSLRVPLSGPPSVAELAPQPGEADNSSDGDLSDLAQASSGGLGAGGAGAGVGVGRGTTTTAEQPGGLPPQRRPRSKRCVGNPPRQTEDPLSPPCVAFFEGDNGGATTKGVSRDEVTVVVWNRPSGSGGGSRFVDWNGPARPEDVAGDTYGRAFTRYFNDRFQTYGRTVRMVGYYPPAGGDNLQGFRSSVPEIEGRKPFAVVPVVGGAVLGPDFARRETFLVSHSAFRRSEHQNVAPYLVSFTPDLEDQAAMAVTYICSKLVGRPVRWSPDQTMRGRARSFGIVSQDFAAEPEYRVLRELLVAELARRCDVHNVPVVAASGESSDRAASYAPAVAALRSEGVTTVIVVASGGVSAQFSQTAASQGYLPEWFIAGGGAGDAGPERNGSGHTHNQSAWSGAFGITFDMRRDAVDLQPWQQAVREGCQDCPASNNTDHPRLYDQLALLFYGIQAAGPKLSAASFDKGMHAIAQRGSPDPYKPAAYFSAGNFSFIKDAMELWWDATGRPPSDNRPGCYRLVRNGARFRAAEWTGDDGDLFQPGAPCQTAATRGPGS